MEFPLWHNGIGSVWSSGMQVWSPSGHSGWVKDPLGCNCSWDLFPSPGTPYATGRPKKKKKEQHVYEKMLKITTYQGNGNQTTVKYHLMAWKIAEQRGVLSGTNRRVFNRRWTVPEDPSYFISDIECAINFITAKILYLFNSSRILFPQPLLWLTNFYP